MTILEYPVSIVGGSGGPNHDSIPAYSDNKAPNGDHPVDPQGHQLMIKNSVVSNIYYVTVNPFILSPEENANSRFVTFKPTGEPNYIKTWIRDPETGHGKPYSPNIDLWLEWSHMQLYNPEPPQPAPELDFSVGFQNEAYDIHIDADSYTIIKE